MAILVESQAVEVSYAILNLKKSTCLAIQVDETLASTIDHTTPHLHKW
jgi:hypothetical protein